MSKASPICMFCGQDGIDRPASFVAAQSSAQGKTISWVFCCWNHVVGWNDGSDWKAPVYKLAYYKIERSHAKNA